MASRVQQLFAARLARRRGETRPDESGALDELDAYGESIGIGRPAGGQSPAPAMPGRPATNPKTATPAGDGLASMNPPSGGAASATRPTGGVPALDALAQTPVRKNRGLMHNRKLGRVLPGGGMGG